METLTGSVERITYYNPENGYSVIKILPEQRRLDAAARDGTVAAVGTLPEINVGEQVEFTGQWVADARYGLQFRVETFRPISPTSEQGITRYLSSGIVRGIGRKTAEKIVDYFGEETLEVLNRTPQRLREVPGLRRKLADRLAQAWAENQSAREAMIFLQGHGISSRFARRIYERYGFETIERVREDPYRLADEIYGIGFMKADAIARNMGIAPDAPTRIRAGLHFALSRLAADGHTYAPRSVLVETVVELLNIDKPDAIHTILNQQILAQELIADTLTEGGEQREAIYLPLYYRSERGVMLHLLAMAQAPSVLDDALAGVRWDGFLAELAGAHRVSLTAQQQGAVQAALTSKLSVLTGGPGTGKTTTLRMVIEALTAIGSSFMLASPTGRAAKRLGEATGQPAKTIHRLLGFKPGEGFMHDDENPLSAEFVIVDEASMLDLVLFYSLLKAVPLRAHLMLVGDVDQLPSVGAGNVLNDVIESGLAHVTRLDTIFRQSADSLIVVNAHRVNQGEAPDTGNQSSDFFFFNEGDPARAAELIVDIVKNRLPGKFGYDPLEDVQVIAPMYRGPVGVNALNDALQAALNGLPRRAEIRLSGRLFRAGDRVLQTRNDYNRDVFNGDIGRIQAIDFEENTLQVVIDGRFVDYEWTEADELTHAYCISTHRSQGSEYPVVVMPVLTQHYLMLQRNLLYTAITRAKKMVVLVGTKKAIHIAVKNNRVAERYSGLLARLRGYQFLHRSKDEDG